MIPAAHPAAPILEFRAVAFAHGPRGLFDDLCFVVQPGQTVALIGPNGSGKTTLLNLAAALLRPAAGQILVHGRELAHWKRRELSCSVALVPQHLEVPFDFRVEELVAQGRLPHQHWYEWLTPAAARGEDRDAIEAALEAVDLVPLRHRVFRTLSGGERQRVKIAIGLAQQPTLMLLDEPTQHLDLGRQIELMGLVHNLSARGITIVAAMHDLALVRDNFSSAILLAPRAPALSGPVSEMLRADLLERAFSIERTTLDRYLTPERADKDDAPHLPQ